VVSFWDKVERRQRLAADRGAELRDLQIELWGWCDERPRDGVRTRHNGWAGNVLGPPARRNGGNVVGGKLDADTVGEVPATGLAAIDLSATDLSATDLSATATSKSHDERYCRLWPSCLSTFRMRGTLVATATVRRRRGSATAPRKRFSGSHPRKGYPRQNALCCRPACEMQCHRVAIVDAKKQTRLRAMRGIARVAPSRGPAATGKDEEPAPAARRVRCINVIG
jgi:hypothetical protein